MTSPPVTPKSQRRASQKSTSGQQSVADIDDFSMYATIPCNCSCDNSVTSVTPVTATTNGPNRNAYDNYDIPRSLCKQVKLIIIGRMVCQSS